eukprot:CAMPEP_0184657642 /NCGR_PEP_ID=MMETSP0308-20130426/20822_1 /TAXON_ID=38269 /ORGANISM="Gloeochaete witrockiana, Strain SAG 46.84" /LENGTH=165 /DNA_ID=CAMNT_0027095715 /DNA_START=591 /DNA_END=1088 /DNA_ORIENTATION=+
MEPDVAPIKPDWTDRLVKEAQYVNDPFWVKAGVSKISCDKWLGKIRFNGNGLFRLGRDQGWMKFTEAVRSEYPGQPYDFSISDWLSDTWHAPEAQKIIHKFVMSDLFSSSDFYYAAPEQHLATTFLHLGPKKHKLKCNEDGENCPKDLFAFEEPRNPDCESPFLV